MIKQILILAYFFSPTFGFSSLNSDAIMGVWLTEMRDVKIEIYHKSDQYFGRVVWLEQPNDDAGIPLVDEKNPNPVLKDGPIFDMDILLGFVYDNDGEWDGKIYDPKVGKTYVCKLRISGLKLKVRGYMGWLFDTKTWTKV